MKQGLLFPDKPYEKDIVYTQGKTAADIIEWVSPYGKCLDPCKGDGAFLDHLPIGSDWCEVREGKDFFDYHKTVEWIIGNPPYSLFEEWIIHSFKISNNVVYLVPTNKIFQRLKIMKIINDYGGIMGIRAYGSGSNIGFPFGFSVAAFHFRRDYSGKTDIILKA